MAENVDGSAPLTNANDPFLAPPRYVEKPFFFFRFLHIQSLTFFIFKMTGL